MSHIKKQKNLVILDLDDTQFPALPRLEKCLTPLINEVAEVRGIERNIVEHMVRDAHGQHRFNDGAGLVSSIVTSNAILHSPCPKLTEEWRKADERIKLEWIKRSQELTVFSLGVFESLKYWKSKDVRVVIQTDCEDIATIRNLWMLGQNACAQGKLRSPFEILQLYDKIYCQPAIEASKELLASVDADFFSQAKDKLHVWNDRLYKPTLAHINTILNDAHATSGQAVYIGDSYKDGSEAGSICPAVDFAWARYGTLLPTSTLNLCARVASKSFVYGEVEIAREIGERGIKPDVILDISLDEVLSVYDWSAPIKHQLTPRSSDAVYAGPLPSIF